MTEVTITVLPPPTVAVSLDFETVTVTQTPAAQITIDDGIASVPVFAEDLDGLVPGPSAAEIAANYVLQADATWVPMGGGGGSGDVVGPASATDEAVARFDTTTGKLIQDSLVTISDPGSISLPALQTVDGRDVSVDGTKLDTIKTGSDVTGPASSTDNAVARFDGVGGKDIQNSLVAITDTGDVTLPGLVDGRDVSVDGAKLDTIESGAIAPPFVTADYSADSVTNPILADMLAARIKGRALGAGTGDPTDLTGSQVNDVLPDFATLDSGLVPGPSAADVTAGRFLRADSTWAAPSGSGDVNGPAVSTDNAIARWDGITGDLLQDSPVTVSDLGSITLPVGETVDGRDVSVDGTKLDTIESGAIAPPFVTADFGDDQVTDPKLANMPAATIKGRATGAGTGDPTNLTGAQTNDILPNFAQDDPGLVPGPTAADISASRVLRADGAWVDTGDVDGPAGATDNALARFDGTTGKLIQDSLVSASDTGSISLPVGQTVDGRDVSVDGTKLDTIKTGSDVTGPASATDNAVARFDGATGKIIQSSGVAIGDTGNVIMGALATVDGRDVSVDGTKLDTIESGAIAPPFVTADFGDNQVTNPKLEDMAASRIKGRAVGAGTGDPTDLTGAQVNDVLPNFAVDDPGLVPGPTAADVTAGRFLRADSAWASPSGSGDVVGPASSTDNAVARFDGTTGKLLQNGLVTVSDTGSISLPALETVDGRDVSVDGTKLDTIETGATADQIASEVPFTPVGDLSSTDVQAALAELDSEKLTEIVEDLTPQLGGQLDVNGFAIGDGTRELLTFVEDALAVNQVEIENQAAGAGPIIRSAGDDTNINLHLTAKGTGVVVVDDGLTVNGSIVVTGTVDGRDVSTDGTKLDTVETGAQAPPYTNAELADMATATIKGRVTAGTGDPEDLTPSQARTVIQVIPADAAPLDVSTAAAIGTEADYAREDHVHALANDVVVTAKIADNQVTDPKLRDSAALSVIGRATNSIGDPADIAAASDAFVLRRSGVTLGFGEVATAGLANDAVTDPKLRNSAGLSVIGRASNSLGDPADIAAGVDGDVLRRSGTTIGFGAIATAGIADDQVTNAKLANMAQATIKGRAVGAGTGDPTDLTAAQAAAIVASAGVDTSAIHDDQSGEISAITLKALPTKEDHLLIEDAAAANVKKRVRFAEAAGLFGTFERVVEVSMTLSAGGGGTTTATTAHGITDFNTTRPIFVFGYLFNSGSAISSVAPGIISGLGPLTTLSIFRLGANLEFRANTDLTVGWTLTGIVLYTPT